MYERLLYLIELISTIEILTCSFPIMVLVRSACSQQDFITIYPFKMKSVCDIELLIKLPATEVLILKVTVGEAARTGGWCGGLGAGVIIP